MARKFYIDKGENNDVENKTRLLYNDTVRQLKKGCSAAW